MAKKTTKPRARREAASASGRDDLQTAIDHLAECEARRAVARATGWAGLLNMLDECLSHADDLSRFGPPLDFEQVSAEHARRCAEISDADSRPTLGDVRRVMQQGYLYALDWNLELAENWLPMVEGYTIGSASDIREVRERLRGGIGNPLVTNAEAIALAIRRVRQLLDLDLARAKSFGPPPSGDDLGLLARILDKPKTAKELAVELAGGKPHLADEKRVERSVDRLRRAHGFALPNTRGAGYSLSPEDRARLDRLQRGT